MGAGEGFQTWVREGAGTPAGRDAVGTAEAPPGSGTQWGPPGLGLGTAEARPGAGSRWGLLWLCGPSHTEKAAALTTQLWAQAEDA